MVVRENLFFQQTHLVSDLGQGLAISKHSYVTGLPECMGTWGLVPTIFWDLAYHFQNCKLVVCTINGSKVTGVSLSPPC